VGDGRCHSCRDFEPEFARAMSFGEYESGLRGLIHLLKYESVLPVASVLGDMLELGEESARLHRPQFDWAFLAEQDVLLLGRTSNKAEDDESCAGCVFEQLADMPGQHDHLPVSGSRVRPMTVLDRDFTTRR
jgi:hypothetical protein